MGGSASSISLARVLSTQRGGAHLYGLHFRPELLKIGLPLLNALEATLNLGLQLAVRDGRHGERSAGHAAALAGRDGPTRTMSRCAFYLALGSAPGDEAVSESAPADIYSLLDISAALRNACCMH